MGEILPREFGVLLVAKVKSDLAALALNHHVENLPVLGHLYPTGALGELDGLGGRGHDPARCAQCDSQLISHRGRSIPTNHLIE